MTRASSNVPPVPEKDPDRRDFIRRMLGASVALGATAIWGATLYDPLGPGGQDRSAGAASLPDFSRPEFLGDRAKMAIVRGGDRATALHRGIEALGGLGRFIQPGDRVLIKVNAAFASPANLGATTHPELLIALTSLCLQAGALEVRVTDNPINDPDSCFRLSGLAEAVAKSGARLVLPQPRHFERFSLPGGRLIRDWPTLLGPFQGVTKLIAAAPVKDHYRAGASMILKNWYGLLGGTRSVFHQEINGLISELARAFRPTLVVLDGTVTMMTNGPTGGSLDDLKKTSTLIVATDQVAADAAGLELLGRKPTDVPYIVQAQAAGAGRADYEKLNPIRLTLGA